MVSISISTQSRIGVPELQLLEEGRHIRGSEVDGARVSTITDTGRALLSERPPWDGPPPLVDTPDDLGDAFRKLAMAVRQASS